MRERRAKTIGNSQIAAEQTGFREVQKTATALGTEAIFVEAPSVPNMDARHEIAEIAARSRLPVIYGNRAFVDSGGLISYGTSRAGLFARAAVFVDKILKGANPADLPVEQPAKYELVINLKTAKTLGLTVPASLLARADEVIE